jgi:NADH-quinone oxidoreductase subunit L
VPLFFRWEMVGLCSYLLIKFWFQKYSENYLNESVIRHVVVLNVVTHRGGTFVLGVSA